MAITLDHDASSLAAAASTTTTIMLHKDILFHRAASQISFPLKSGTTTQLNAAPISRRWNFAVTRATGVFSCPIAPRSINFVPLPADRVASGEECATP